MNNTASLHSLNKTMIDLITENYDKDYKKCRDVVFSILYKEYKIDIKEKYLIHSINKRFLLVYLNYKQKPKLYLIKS